METSKKEVYGKFINKIPWLWILLILTFIFLIFRNNFNINKLRNNGQLTKGYIYRKSLVGSKGTIRCFYTFDVGGRKFEGFYDNDNLKKGDSLLIIY